MSALSKLISCSGTWTGVNKLQDPSNNVEEQSPSTVIVNPILGGKFVRIDYKWEYKGAPQEGMILIGYQSKADSINAYWIDSWHMGEVLMVCKGIENEGNISVLGSYAAPPGPDWGWRINILPHPEDHLRIAMYNIWPEGKEELAVEMEHNSHK